MLSNRRTTGAEPIKIFIGGLLLLIGLMICFRAASNNGQDFSYLYVLGRLLSEGKNPYILANAEGTFLTHCGQIPNNGYAAIFYPPTTGLVVLPLALLPFKVAWNLWLLLSLFLLPWALWRLLKILDPHLSQGNCVLILGATACASSVRWSVQLLQSAILLTALAALFLNALLTKKIFSATVYTVLALCLKLTLALPFVGILLLCRKFKAVGLAVALFGIAMVIAFLIAGGTPALTAYKNSMAAIETDAQQINSPDPYLYQSLPRLDFPYLLHWLRRDASFARTGGIALTLICVVILLWQGWQARVIKDCSHVALLFYPSLACLTLLIVYHHHYDGILLLLAFVLTLHPLFAPVRSVLLLFGLPLLFYLTLFPQAQVQFFLTSYGGLAGSAFAKTFGALATVLFFIGSLVANQRILNLSSTSSLKGEMPLVK